MVDRTIPFGDPANAEYFTGEGGSDPPDGNFVVAETAAGTKLMEYDATASEWVVRGDVNMSGQDLSVGSVDANSVSTDGINNGRSGRFGDTVYYDPRDTGPYVDLTDAIADLPPGGTLRLAATEIDVTTEGRVTNDEPINVVGAGYGIRNTSRRSIGTRITNIGAGAIDNPAVEFIADGGNANQFYSLRKTRVRHGGASPAVRYDNTTRTTTEDVEIVGTGSATKGLELVNNAFFAAARNVKVISEFDVGIDVQGNGSEYLFTNCQTNIDNTGSVGFRGDNNGVKIYGGQYDAEAIAMQFRAGSSNMEGGPVIVSPFVEATTPAVELTSTDTGKVRNATIFALRTLLSSGPRIKFDYAEGCTALFPQFMNTNGGGTGDAVELTSNAIRNRIVTSHSVMDRATVTDNGGENIIEYPEALTNFHIGQLPTGADSRVAWSTSQQSPAWYDTQAGSWKELSGSLSTFAP